MLSLGWINKAPLAAAEEWLQRVVAPKKLSPPHTPPMMAENTGEHPGSSTQCSVPTLGEGYVGSASFRLIHLLQLLCPSPSSAPHILLLPPAELLCAALPCFAPLASWVYSVYVYMCIYIRVCVFFTVLALSFCLSALHLVLSCFFPFMFPMSWIAQYITKYHSVTLYHTHLSLLLFQAAPPPK